MGAYKGTLIALNTMFDLPFRNIQSDTALFVSGCAHRECSVFTALECADREIVAFLTVHRNHEFLDEGWQVIYHCLAGAGTGHMLNVTGFILCVFPSFRHADFYCGLHAFFNRGIVHVNYFLPLVAVIVNHCFLQILHGFFQRNDGSQFKERGLHDHIDAAAQPQLLGNPCAINRIKLNFIFRNKAFHETGKFFIQFLGTPGAVQQKDSLGF